MKRRFIVFLFIFISTQLYAGTLFYYYTPDYVYTGVREFFLEEYEMDYDYEVPSGMSVTEFIYWFNDLGYVAEYYNWELINAYRDLSNESALGYDDDVAEAAELHSFEMAITGEFTHDGTYYGFTSKDRVEYTTGIEYPDVGENIYLHKTTQQYNPLFAGTLAFMGFYSSERHNANMLHWYWYYCGVDVSVYWDGTYYCYYCTQNFRGLANTDYSIHH